MINLGLWLPTYGGWLRNVDETEKSPTYDYAKKVAVRAGGQLEFAVPALSFVRDSDRQAEKYVKDLAGGNENALHRTLETGLVGSPETVASEIRKLEEAGIEHLLLHFTPTLTELERFADQVLSLVQAA